MIRVTFDPGLRVAGLAVYTDDVLSYANIVRSDCLKERGPYAWLRMATAVVAVLADAQVTHVDRLVVELMQVYAKQIGDPANILELQGVVGAVVARIDADQYVGYLPRIWKNNLQKDLQLEAIMAQLSPAELLTLQQCPASLAHNRTDAIGLGLFDLGRLAKRHRTKRENFTLAGLLGQ